MSWNPWGYVRGPFAQFVDSPYYFESELCGGAVTVTFSKYLSWQAMHFLQRSTNFSKTHCRPLFEISCLGAPFSLLEKPRNRMGRDLNWILCSLWKKWIGGTPLEHPPYSSDLAPMQFLNFSNHKKGALRQEISKWSTVCSAFSRSGRSVVRSASLAKRGNSKKWPSPHLHSVLTRSNKVSPRTFQMTLVYKSLAHRLSAILLVNVYSSFWNQEFFVFIFSADGKLSM
jgi:hypothetical protein